MGRLRGIRCIEVVSGNIERDLVHLSETYGWINYKSTSFTLHIEDPNSVVRERTSYYSIIQASSKLEVMRRLFDFVCMSYGGKCSWRLSRHA